MESNERLENAVGVGPRKRHGPRQFRLWSTSGPDGVVLRACGRLALGHGASDGLWRRHVRGARRVSVDLTGVTELDARGLGVLAGLAARARQHGVALSVVGASRVARSLATLARLDQVLAGAWDRTVPLARVSQPASADRVTTRPRRLGRSAAGMPVLNQAGAANRVY